MKNKIKSITLSTGEIYTPEKGKPPVYPCLTCKNKTPAKFVECFFSCTCDVCDAYMDYEYMLAVYKTTVF